MTDIRHIVFDVGNVLIRWDPERPYRALIPDEAERKRFLAEVCNADWLTVTDRGKTWPEAEEMLIARFPDQADRIRAFRRHWHAMVPHALGETVVVLEDLLEEGHDVTGLTNFAADTFLEILPRFVFLGRMRGITVSSRVGHIKPEPEIFRIHAETFDLDPRAILFFDDSPANVDSARKAGWNAERFVDAETMRAELARHGIALAAAGSR